MQEDKKSINGLRMNYENTGGGPAILILHGWGRGAASWVKVRKILTSYGYRVIVFDLPGFGNSNPPDSIWGVDDYVNLLIGFVKNLNLGKFFLLGHSFGARIAVKFAARYPKKLSGLILVSSAGIKHEKTAGQLFLLKISKAGRALSFLPFFPFFRRIFYRYVVRTKDYFEAKGIMKEVLKKVVDEDLTPFLKKITIPTLIVWGGKDKITPLSDAYLINREIPNSVLKIIPAVGHAIHLEATEKLAKIVSQFLNPKKII